MGFIYKVVPHEELEKEALELGKNLAEMPTLAIGKAKAILNRTFTMTLDELLAEEKRTQAYLSGTEDHREGIRALLEKRKPKFQGK
jgi:2-(1,2-epoxy-1,2-dihydrophenyl)acetyl-CoA isomerase